MASQPRPDAPDKRELPITIQPGMFLSPEEKRALIEAALAESDRLTTPGRTRTPGWLLIREDRDSR